MPPELKVAMLVGLIVQDTCPVTFADVPSV
jgi:hypothetical protein